MIRFIHKNMVLGTHFMVSKQCIDFMKVLYRLPLGIGYPHIGCWILPCPPSRVIASVFTHVTFNLLTKHKILS